jgi:hypothetical protein
LRLAQLIEERRLDWQNPRHRRARLEHHMSNVEAAELSRGRGGTARGWGDWKVQQLVEAYRLSESAGVRGSASWLAQKFGLLVRQPPL